MKPSLIWGAGSRLAVDRLFDGADAGGAARIDADAMGW